jgi:riboflavin synthase
MFTGLISDIGEVVGSENLGEMRRLTIACRYRATALKRGASIACAGPCLTIIKVAQKQGRTLFDVDVGAETLARTTAATWRIGTRINLERSLRIGEEIGGHLVSGHVDDTALVVSRREFDGMAQFEIEAPESLAKFIAEKGSVSLDGTSLTVNAVKGSRFAILLIPHTLAVTTWGATTAGDRVNLEIDQMARYAARHAEVTGWRRLAAKPGPG